MKKEKQTFENALNELEKVVESMESSELELDKCLEEYEKGVKLADFCSKELDAAQRRIEKLKKNKNGEFETVELDEEVE